MTAFEHTLNYLYKFTIGEGNHQAGASLESLREIWLAASQKAYSSDWATYFLFMYERAGNAGVERLSKQEISGEKNTLNIEHIMPKSAAEGEPDTYWTDEGEFNLPRFTAQEIENHLDDLGNLVLSRDYTNQHLYENHSYDVKREMYLHFLILKCIHTHQLAQCTSLKDGIIGEISRESPKWPNTTKSGEFSV